MEQQASQKQEQQQQPEQQAGVSGEQASAEQPSHQPVSMETPQVVVDRMFKRMLIFMGLPVATGLVLFPLFWYLKVMQQVIKLGEKMHMHETAVDMLHH